MYTTTETALIEQASVIVKLTKERDEARAEAEALRLENVEMSISAEMLRGNKIRADSARLRVEQECGDLRLRLRESREEYEAMIRHARQLERALREAAEELEAHSLPSSVAQKARKSL